MIKEITAKQVKKINDQGTGGSAYLELERESMGASWYKNCYDDFLYTVDGRKYKYLATVSVLKGNEVHYYLIKTNSSSIVNFCFSMKKLSEIIWNVHEKLNF